jgi:hypothetical protein
VRADGVREPWAEVMTRALLGAVCAAVACAALACGEPDDGAPVSVDTSLQPDASRAVVLGTGEAEFEPIDGEPHLRLVAGVQGGFHVWASFLAYGFTSDRLDMLLETVVDDEPSQRLVMRARVSTRETLDSSGAPARAFAGFPAQVHDARCAQDKRVRVALTLTDADGASATDERYCVADLEQAQRRSDCE